MNQAHTPGPWRYVGRHSAEIVDCALQRTICSVSRALKMDGEMDANARLIAAAPSMLAALEAVVTHHADFENMTAEAAAAMRQARAIVRQAKGE